MEKKIIITLSESGDFEVQLCEDVENSGALIATACKLRPEFLVAAMLGLGSFLIEGDQKTGAILMHRALILLSAIDEKKAQNN